MRSYHHRGHNTALIGLSVAGIIIAAALPAPASAQEARVLGSVRTAEAGAPVTGARISVEGVTAEVVTGPDGRFMITGVPAGSRVVTVRRLGYDEFTQTVDVPSRGDVELAVRLEISAILVDPIVVTATLDPRSEAEALRPIQVLEGRELDRSRGPTIAETLAGEPGVTVASMGPAPARPVIRGFAGDRILMLEDGQEIGDVSSTAGDHAVATDGGSAEQIEVIRGPAALFYGSNALGGVVNVVRDEIPRAAPDGPSGAVLLQGQSVYRGVAGSGALEVPVGRFVVRGEANGRNTGDMRTPEGDLFNSDLRTWSAAAAVSHVGESGYGGIGVRYYDSFYGIAPDSVSGHPSGVDIDLKRLSVRANGEREGNFGPFEHLKAEAGHTTYDHREIEASGAAATQFDRSTYYLEVEAHHEETGPFAAGGLGVRADLEDYQSNNGRDRVDSRGTTLSLFGVEEWRAGRFAVQGGLRLDRTVVDPQIPITVRGIEARRRSFTAVAASLAGLLEVAPDVRIGASLARSTRTPSAEQLFSLGPHLASYTFEVGNPELEVETGVGADFFIRVSRPRVRAEVVGFTSTIQDFIFAENTGEQRGSLFVYRFTNTEARYSGAEASMDWNPTGGLVLGGNASLVRATDTEADEGLPFIPPLQGRVFARFEKPTWFAGATVRWAGQQDRLPERPDLPANSPGYCDQTGPGELCRPVPGEFLPTDGYAVLDGSVGYRWWKGDTVHSITLRVDNITNTTYRNHLSRLKELTPEPGFGVSLSYRWTF